MNPTEFGLSMIVNDLCDGMDTLWANAFGTGLGRAEAPEPDKPSRPSVPSLSQVSSQEKEAGGQ